MSMWRSLGRLGPGGGALLCAAILMLTGGGTAHATTIRTVHKFCGMQDCRDGGEPEAGLVRDVNGNIYGYTGCCDTPNSVFELTPQPGGKWQFNLLFSTCNGNCLELVGKLVIDTAGNLYGVQVENGANGTGEIVEFPVPPDGKKRKMKVLYEFGPTTSDDGNYPFSGLTYAGAASGLAYDGVSPLYGTTHEGGVSTGGTIYQFTPGSGGTWTEKVLYSFCAHGGDCTDGISPFAAPVLDGAGNLYGTTPGGGNASDNGVVYELSNNGGTWTQTLLHINCKKSDCKDGALDDELIFDGAGNLLGVGRHGRHDKGVIAKLVPNGTASHYSVLYDFCSVGADCRDGTGPTGGLYLDAFGNLFGATLEGGGHDTDFAGLGGGTIFELSGSTLTTLHAFCAKAGCGDGEYPNGDLVPDGNGNLLGTVRLGGKLQQGMVLEITP